MPEPQIHKVYMTDAALIHPTPEYHIFTLQPLSFITEEEEKEEEKEWSQISLLLFLYSLQF